MHVEQCFKNSSELRWRKITLQPHLLPVTLDNKIRLIDAVLGEMVYGFVLKRIYSA